MSELYLALAGLSMLPIHFCALELAVYATIRSCYPATMTAADSADLERATFALNRWANL